MFKLSFRHQVSLGFVVSIALVLVVGIFSYRSLKQLQNDTVWVEHSHQVIKSSDILLQKLVDAETGMRGYVATGNEVFLEPYHAALHVIGTELSSIKEQTKDNAAQQIVADSLAALTSAQLNVLRQNIDVRHTQGLQYFVQHAMLTNGKAIMDNIRREINHLNANESQLLQQRKLKTDAATEQAVITLIIGSVIFLVIILVLLVYIQDTFRKQKKNEKVISRTNRELEVVIAQNKTQNWLLSGSSRLNEKMQGQQNEKEIAQNILEEVCSYTQALTGTLYLYNEPEQLLELYAYYAFHDLSLIKPQIKLGESWLGQVAKSGKSATIKGNVNEKLRLQTSIINQDLAEILIVPFFFDKELKGVMEIAFQQEAPQNIMAYVEHAASDIGIAVNTAQARSIMQRLYEETQQQAEELEAQQEEMRVTNEELMTKTGMLQASEEELKTQQEELRIINAELEEKASLLEEKNHAIEEARRAINEKVDQLEASGRYKSEFLANMSHELRTPLNSILVLARILKDNKSSNLTADQIKYASVIFNAGNDLLTLINDILDLSKIESGKLEIQNEALLLTDVMQGMHMLFDELATNKKINFISHIGNLPNYMVTDRVRLEQIIKNLLSNAFKFTAEGGTVSLDIKLGAEPQTVDYIVKDTGIGIAPDKQKIIFEAFQQADGATNRRFGGTGLGLSISKELASLLGGRIFLWSEPGKGSQFTLTLPVERSQSEVGLALKTALPVVPEIKLPNPVNIEQAGGEPLVVIVEDDSNFAEVLETYAKDHGYKALLVHDGLSAVEIIAKNKPHAVILDIVLPGKDGWQILKELKQNPITANIPIHLMSGTGATEARVKREGAISFMKKPIDTEVLDKLFNEIMGQSGAPFKQVLLIEDHQVQSEALKELMQGQGITVDQAFDGHSAWDLLQQNDYQCVILDLDLPDISGLDLLDKIKETERFESLPVIINTAMELDKDAVTRLMKYANAMVIKTNKSSDRLIDEVNLFLNKVSAADPQRRAPKSTPGVNGGKEVLKGKKVLIVDDDMRNIFALSSALQAFDLQVEVANDGEEALEKLNTLGGVDIVLMDIMMPKMDGYEATRELRKQPQWAKLPVIALTAKAMKEDRDKSIAAGANDYITKPVDVDRLISLMQLWMEA